MNASLGSNCTMSPLATLWNLVSILTSFSRQWAQLSENEHDVDISVLSPATSVPVVLTGYCYSSSEALWFCLMRMQSVWLYVSCVVPSNEFWFVGFCHTCLCCLLAFNEVAEFLLAVGHMLGLLCPLFVIAGTNDHMLHCRSVWAWTENLPTYIMTLIENICRALCAFMFECVFKLIMVHAALIHSLTMCLSAVNICLTASLCSL